MLNYNCPKSLRKDRDGTLEDIVAVLKKRHQ